MVPINAADTIEEVDNKDWVVEIEMKYRSYDPAQDESESIKKSIYKWPNDFAPGMLMHRTPQVASFGPYHHGKEALQPMEHHKERALYRIMKRSGASLSTFINSLEKVEKELGDSYDDLDPKLTSDSFLRMMLLDGCFMLELLSHGSLSKLNSSSDPVFSWYGGSTIIRRDMLLLENQIPLLVLRKLVGVVNNSPLKKGGVEGGGLNHSPLKKGGVKEGKDVNKDEFLKEYGFLKDLFVDNYGKEIDPGDDVYLHILDIYRKCVIGRKEETPRSENGCLKSVCSPCQSRLRKLLDIATTFIFKLLSGRPNPLPKNQERLVRSAMRFHQAGVEFKDSKPVDGLKITFSKESGVLTLPPIVIEDYTAAIYMNMVAFERMHPKLWKERNVTSYVAFMDILIDTAEDVSLLCKRGIMGNHLGSDEEAAKIFNNLGIGTSFCLDYDVDTPLQKYVASGWNAAKADLMRKYFRNPWSTLSLLGAVVLLVLTFIQTLFSAHIK